MTNNDDPITKVIDFGFAVQSQAKLQIFCGTPAYMSPEIVAKGKYDGPASDMWAAGILLYTMLFGIQPFRAQQEKDLFKKIAKGQYQMPLMVKKEKILDTEDERSLNEGRLQTLT